MISQKHIATLLGFAFVAAWLGFGFGYAVLCLVGAGGFYAAATYLEGDLDLAALQARVAPRSGPRQATSAAPPPRPRARPRVR